MSNEIALSMSLAVYKSSVMANPDGMNIAGFLATMAGDFRQKGSLSVGTSATVVPLGGVTTPGYGIFHNLDATNYLCLRNGATGADVVELLAGEWALFRFKSTGTLYAVAHTAACEMEYLLLSS